ncbi:hypothetical protein HXX25_02820 [Hyphobacterium sp. CCMP332]|uniref:hypothetical protein n=1 Tax=Hyphobacterium sp. CCMP332 TaxID=2749086 RepID=UPI0016506BE2|nr:hypothetical protein [Hyphobacterium sp. CCMP332]QNL18363.1 hypothetical protein HXX25_02820 [Hyphobacterium sp. CCMP332]
MDISPFDFSALTGWYQAKNATRLANLTPRASGASAGEANPAARQGAGVLPPWDVRGEITGLDEVSRKVLASGNFFDSKLSEFSGTDASTDIKSLFAMHQGLRRLYALANEAADKTTIDSRRSFLDRRFNEGLGQLDSFFQDIDLQGVSVLKGEELSKAESSVAVKRGLSEYTTGILHSGDFDAEVATLTGDVQFTVSVKKSGVTTAINIDLADMGATVRNLDNIAAHINSELEAAEMISRFERVKIGEKDENGIVPGNNFGFKISGASTEVLTFSAASASPAIYIAGNSGLGDSAAGQVVKLTDIASGTPTSEFSRRLEAGADELTTVDDDGKEKTTTEANPLEISATALGQDGALYVLGKTSAGIEGRIVKGESDLVLQKIDSTGKTVWTRTLGAADEAAGASLTVDANGDIVVAGSVQGALGETTDIGGTDSFVAKFDAAGVEQWLQRFGGTGNDRPAAVTVADDGRIFVAGQAATAFGGEGHQGGANDGYVRAFNADGTLDFTRRIGASGDERAEAVAIASDGGLLVASNEDGRAILRKYDSADSNSAALWEVDLGDMEDGAIGGLTVDGDDIYFAGSAGAGFAPSAPLTAHSGGRDAVVVKLTDGATPTTQWTQFVGSDADDSASSIQISGGKVYIAGKTTGELSGATQNGTRNSFAASIDAATGTTDFATQISGRGGVSAATGIAIDPDGDSILDDLGLPSGTLAYADTRVVTDRTSVRDGDFFYLSVDGGRRKKITIDADDSMRSLTFKINAALVLDGSGDVGRTKAGDILRITPKPNVTIELFAGSEGRDALAGLGLKPGAVTGKESFLDRDKTSAAPKVFALELSADFSLANRERAKVASKALEDAMNIVQRAYRDLTTPQALKDLLNGEGKGNKGGSVPAYLSAQIANYSAGLARLQSGGPAGGGFF